MAEITLPHLFVPRPYQTPFLNAWDSGNKENGFKPYKRLMLVAHRRMGKDKMVFANLAKKMMQRKGTYFYFLPTYNQARKIIWNGADKEGFRFLDHFPKEIIKKTNESEMIVELTNGSILQMVGGDNIDRIVGTNPVGVVFSEYALMKPEVWKLTSPILAENGGWAVFIFTPRGKNHAYELLIKAQKNPNWYVEILPVSKTRALSEDILLEEKMNMTQQYFDQEYECFPKGTDIITDDGVKDISNIKIGDRVLTHANRYRKVLRTFQHKHSGDLINIESLGNNKTLSSTLNHPIRTTDDGVTYSWKKAEHFKKGDFITIPKPLLKKNKIISANNAKIIAWFIAEGSFSNNQVSFSLNENEIEYQNEILQALDYSAKIYKNGRGAANVVVNSVELGEFLIKNCGSGAGNKKIPLELIAGHEQVVYNTLIKGDGCNIGKHRDLYTTISKTLAYQVQLLANSLGYTGSFSLAKKARKEMIEGREVNCQNIYTVRINKKAKELSTFLDKNSKIKPKKYSVIAPVTNVTVSDFDGIVYNFEVQTDNSYVANSRIVHNCDFTSNASAVFQDVRSRTYPVNEYEFNDAGKYQIGVDLAKVNDYTVITPFDLTTFKVGPQDSFNQIDYTLQKTKIEAAFLRHNKGRVVMDSTGVGVPIVDDLLNKGINIAPYTFTFNSRNELLTNLQILLEQNKIKIPDDEELLQQLEAAVWDIGATGRSRVVVPEPMHDDCFVKGTKILTDKGQVPIEKIKVGDLVMTREGYKPVEMTRSKLKKVINNIGLRGTLNHPVILADGNEKSLSKVTHYDTLHVWNSSKQKIQKLSYTKAKDIIGNQTQKEDHTGSIIGDTTNGKNHQLRYIGNSGLIKMVQSLKDFISITKTKILSITKYLTWGVFHQKITPEYILKQEILNRESVNFVRKPLLQKSETMQNSAEHSVGEDIEMVYNLQISEKPEYFANNVLVHNCMMSLALAVWDIPTRPIQKESIYQQLSRKETGIEPMYPEFGI